MIGAIPNPQRSITLNYPVDHVTEVLNELSEVHKVMRIEGYTLQEKTPTILQWKFQKTEFLSLGSIIIVHLEEVGDRTKMSVEVTRVLGAFDSWVEVQNANKHLDVIFKSVAFGLNPPSEKEVYDLQVKQESANSSNNAISIIVGVIAFFVMLGVIL
jgi:hypothetical protein